MRFTHDRVAVVPQPHPLSRKFSVSYSARDNSTIVYRAVFYFPRPEAIKAEAVFYASIQPRPRPLAVSSSPRLLQKYNQWATRSDRINPIPSGYLVH